VSNILAGQGRIVLPPRNLIFTATFEVPEQVTDQEMIVSVLQGMAASVAIASTLRSTNTQIVPASPKA
jgi:hypothetical protein